MNKNEKKYKTSYLFYMILIIIIIVLLLQSCTLMGSITNQDKTLIPTGNVDVFDINLNCNCLKDECTSNVPIFDEDKDLNLFGEVFVDDKNGNYVYQQKLAIFENTAFELPDKIAPGDKGLYYFIVHNSTSVTVKYNIKTYETSEYKVNLKYRLKQGDTYVAGDATTWLEASDINTAFATLALGESKQYVLEWQWFDDDYNDTIAGINMRSEYQLNIRVYFEAVIS